MEDSSKRQRTLDISQEVKSLVVKFLDSMTEANASDAAWETLLENEKQVTELLTMLQGPLELPRYKMKQIDAIMRWCHKHRKEFQEFLHSVYEVEDDTYLSNILQTGMPTSMAFVVSGNAVYQESCLKEDAIDIEMTAFFRKEEDKDDGKIEAIDVSYTGECWADETRVFYQLEFEWEPMEAAMKELGLDADEKAVAWMKEACSGCHQKMKEPMPETLRSKMHKLLTHGSCKWLEDILTGIACSTAITSAVEHVTAHKTPLNEIETMENYPVIWQVQETKAAVL